MFAAITYGERRADARTAGRLEYYVRGEAAVRARAPALSRPRA